MIEISISRELAAEHPGFVAGCAERGHRIELFGDRHKRPQSLSAGTRDPDDMPNARPTSASPAVARRASPARTGRPRQVKRR
jgi:hypothetical protein